MLLAVWQRAFVAHIATGRCLTLRTRLDLPTPSCAVIKRYANQLDARMESSPKTQEPQYSLLYDVKEKHGIARLGLMVNESWNQDPKRTLFTLARYKFVAKMLAGRERVLEVGCADAFGTRIVQQSVGKVTATDFDPLFVADAKERMNPHWPFEIFVHDILA